MYACVRVGLQLAHSRLGLVISRSGSSARCLDMPTDPVSSVYGLTVANSPVVCWFWLAMNGKAAQLPLSFIA